MTFLLFQPLSTLFSRSQHGLEYHIRSRKASAFFCFLHKCDAVICLTGGRAGMRKAADAYDDVSSNKEDSMKRTLVVLFLAVCVLLSGCGSGAAEKRFADFSESLSGQDTLSFSAELRAEYPDRTLNFALDYTRDDSGQTILVRRPERIAGIRAHLAAGSETLEFDGLILDTGPLDPYGLSPMNALPKLVEALCSGHLDSHWEENGSPVYQLVLDDHLSASVWFDAQRMTPSYAELQSDDTVHIFCTISDWHTD